MDPTPVSEVSTSTMNVFLASGYFRMGTVVNACFRAQNAQSAELDQMILLAPSFNSKVSLSIVYLSNYTSAKVLT